MWKALTDILLGLSPWLLLGAAVAGLLHLLVPASRLQQMLQGRRGLLTSVLVGIPLPLCSCSVIPVGIGLRKDGVSPGASLGFLISTPQTGVDSVLVSASFLGWPFALFKVAAALVMGVLGGAMTQVLPESSASDEPALQSSACAGRNKPAPAPWGQRIRAAAQHSIDLIRSIWRWLVVGIVASALISWLIPPDQFQNLSGNSGLLAMLLTLVISLPLYVCATASVPIAAALVSSGLPAGAAMVFLMAGPATNLATLGAVYRTFGRTTTAVYLLTMIAGSISAGLLFDSVLPVQTARQAVHHHHHGIVSIASAFVVAGLILWFAVDDIKRRRQPAETGSSQEFQVDGMNCENCARGLERALNQVDGVQSADVSFAASSARISGNASTEQLLTTIRNKGFTAQPKNQHP